MEDGTADDLKKETLEMIKALGIPEAAAAFTKGEYADKSTSEGKKSKKKKRKLASSPAASSGGTEVAQRNGSGSGGGGAAKNETLRGKPSAPNGAQATQLATPGKVKELKQQLPLKSDKQNAKISVSGAPTTRQPKPAALANGARPKAKAVAAAAKKAGDPKISQQLTPPAPHGSKPRATPHEPSKQQQQQREDKPPSAPQQRQSKNVKPKHQKRKEQQAAAAQAASSFDASTLPALDMTLKHPVASLTEEADKWFLLPAPGLASGAAAAGADGPPAPLPPAATARLREAAQGLFDAEVAAWEKKREQRQTGDDRWLAQVLRAGTLSDRVSALTLQVQESPVHRLSALDKLVALVAQRERRSAQMALQALQDLLTNNLLPDDRRLIRFEARPLALALKWADEDGSGVGKALVFWWFEDQLHQRVDTILSSLERMSHDPLDSFKRLAMQSAEQLLTSKPHGEARLLSLLVNKLGDPTRTAAAQAIHLLQMLLSKHPAMRGVVVREVQQYLHRPGLSPRAMYAGVVFLTQVYLKPEEDADLTASLVRCYFQLFEQAVKAGDLQSKLLSALLTGVNRAHPYMGGSNGTSGSGGGSSAGKLLGEHVDQLFKLVHQSSFGTATQALMLLFQLVMGSENERHVTKKGPKGENSSVPASQTDLAARFYSALYSKLLDSGLVTAHNPTLFLNLLYRAMKRDHDASRVAAFAKRLLQSAGGLGGGGGAPLAAAALFVVSEVLKKHQALRRPLFASPDAPLAPLDDTSGGEDAAGSAVKAVPSPAKSESNGVKNEPQRSAPPSQPQIPGYDPTKRDPRYACTSAAAASPNSDATATTTTSAAAVSLWEATLLRYHFHPSVQRFAEQLLSPPGHGIRYSGDPLADFALPPFLDKMAYRNPKKAAAAAVQQKGRMARAMPTGAAAAALAAPVNDYKFASLPQEAVAADRVFFHRFFREKARRDRMKGVSQKKKPSSEVTEDLDSEAEEDAFADNLAEELMRKHASGTGADMDDDDDVAFSSDDEAANSETEQFQVAEDGRSEDGDVEADVMEESESEGEEQEQEAAEAAAAAADGGSESNSADESDLAEVAGLFGGSDGNCMSSGASSDEEEEGNGGAGAGSKREKPVAAKRKRASDGDVFASVDDYADVLANWDPDALDGGVGPSAEKAVESAESAKMSKTTGSAAQAAPFRGRGSGERGGRGLRGGGDSRRGSRGGRSGSSFSGRVSGGFGGSAGSRGGRGSASRGRRGGRGSGSRSSSRGRGR